MSPLARMCVTRGCQEIIPLDGPDRCQPHQKAHLQRASKREAPRRQAKPQRRIYNDPRWRACRQEVLKQARHTCQLCGRRANTVDHYPHPLTTLLTKNIDPFNPTMCRALCASCHGHHDGPRSMDGSQRTEQIMAHNTPLTA